MRAKWAAMLTFENPINSLSAIGLEGAAREASPAK